MTAADLLRLRLSEAEAAQRRHVRLTIKEAQTYIAMLDAVAGIADQAEMAGRAAARDEA